MSNTIQGHNRSLKVMAKDSKPMNMTCLFVNGLSEVLHLTQSLATWSSKGGAQLSWRAGTEPTPPVNPSIK